MPMWLWLLLVIIILVVVASQIQENLIRVMFYALALICAVVLVLRFI